MTQYHGYRKSAAQPKLSIIITLKTVEHYDMIHRLNYRILQDDALAELVEFVVVDYNSHQAGALKHKCVELGFNYIHVTADDSFFNAGKSRNIGAIYSKGTFICHEDIDLHGYGDQYYRDLLDEIDINNLEENNKNFISVPVIYLSEDASTEFFNTPERLRKSKFLHYLLINDRSKFTFYMPASSVIIIHRYYYLMIGGYNEDFKGWGLEDLEYAFRITQNAHQFHQPAQNEVLVTKPDFSMQYDYAGWRTRFRLHGDLLGKKGIVLFHIHHPIDRTWRNSSKHQNNKALFDRCVKNFLSQGNYLSPLPYRAQRTLLFGKGCFAYNNAMIPLWGDIDIRGYEYFDDINIIDYIKENKIDQVIFTNPYANEKRLSTYNTIKDNNISFHVIERGALNDSLFIDSTGFCCESSLYQAQYWDKTLSQHDYQKTLQYIENEKNTSFALEKQDQRKNTKQIKQELGIAEFKKILFVPLQSRSDTTVNFFAGDIGSYDNFISLLNELSSLLPHDWQLIVKRHPLSKVEENINNAKFVDDYHIKDIIELSDYILLMNSGVGVLATIWNKPVIYTATAFYANKQLNRKAVSAQGVLDILNSGFKPKEEDCIKFIGYLINEFYSFGKMKTKLANYTEQSNLTITESIDIYHLNYKKQTYFFKSAENNIIPYQYELYTPFRKSISEKGKPNPTKAINSNTPNKPTSKTSPPKQTMLISNIKRKLNKLQRNPRLFFKDMFVNLSKRI